MLSTDLYCHFTDYSWLASRGLNNMYPGSSYYFDFLIESYRSQTNNEKISISDLYMKATQRMFDVVIYTWHNQMHTAWSV